MARTTRRNGKTSVACGEVIFISKGRFQEEKKKRRGLKESKEEGDFFFWISPAFRKIKLDSLKLFCIGYIESKMALPMETITCEQVFSRSSLGFLWAKRDQLDPGQRSILDSLYMGRKKGSIDGILKVDYRLPKTGVGRLGFG